MNCYISPIFTVEYTFYLACHTASQRNNHCGTTVTHWQVINHPRLLWANIVVKRVTLLLHIKSAVYWLNTAVQGITNAATQRDRSQCHWAWAHKLFILPVRGTSFTTRKISRFYQIRRRQNSKFQETFRFVRCKPMIYPRKQTVPGLGLLEELLTNNCEITFRKFLKFIIFCYCSSTYKSFNQELNELVSIGWTWIVNAQREWAFAYSAALGL